MSPRPQGRIRPLGRPSMSGLSSRNRNYPQGNVVSLVFGSRYFALGFAKYHHRRLATKTMEAGQA
jgi:hypothetical protein